MYTFPFWSPATQNDMLGQDTVVSQSCSVIGSPAVQVPFVYTYQFQRPTAMQLPAAGQETAVRPAGSPAAPASWLEFQEPPE